MVGQGEWKKAPWRKSKRSATDDPTGCVCLAAIGSWAAIRDSKSAEFTILVIPRTALRDLFQEIKQGTLDLR